MKSSILFKLLLLTLFVSCINAEVLNFSRAYELALENANAIKSSSYMSQSDKEKITQEEAQLYPQVNLSAFYKKSEYVSNPAQNKTRQGLMNYSLTAKQSLYNPEIYSRIDIQESRSEYSTSRVELEKEELAQNLFNAYLDVLKSRNRIALNESYLEYSKYKLQEITKKYDMRMSNKMDLLEMKVENNSAKIDLNKEKKLFSVYHLKLKQLIGDIEYELPYINYDKSIVGMISSMRESVSSTGESLKVKQAEIVVQIQKSEIENASDAHLPKVSLDASYAKYDTDDPTIDAPFDSTKSIMVSLNIPIYSGGYVSSRVAAAQLMRKAADEDLLNTKKQVKVEHDEYFALFDASAESVSMYKEALDAGELYVEAITKGYDHGLKSINDLNEAKSKLYEVKYKYIENIYEMVNAYIGLLIVNNNIKDISLLDKLVD